MSAAYDAAGKALGVVDEVVHEEPDSVPTSTYALLGIGRALLALTDEVEQVVELLRTLGAEPDTDEVVQHAGPTQSSSLCDVCALPFAPTEKVTSLDGRHMHDACDPRTPLPDPRYPPMRTS